MSAGQARVSVSRTAGTRLALTPAHATLATLLPAMDSAAKVSRF